MDLLGNVDYSLLIVTDNLYQINNERMKDNKRSTLRDYSDVYMCKFAV